MKYKKTTHLSFFDALEEIEHDNHDLVYGEFEFVLAFYASTI